MFCRNFKCFPIGTDGLLLKVVGLARRFRVVGDDARRKGSLFVLYLLGDTACRIYLTLKTSPIGGPHSRRVFRVHPRKNLHVFASLAVE